MVRRGVCRSSASLAPESVDEAPGGSRVGSAGAAQPGLAADASERTAKIASPSVATTSLAMRGMRGNWIGRRLLIVLRPVGTTRLPGVGRRGTQARPLAKLDYSAAYASIGRHVHTRCRPP